MVDTVIEIMPLVVGVKVVDGVLEDVEVVNAVLIFTF